MEIKTAEEVDQLRQQLIQLRHEIEVARGQQTGGPAGRYLSMAITALEEAGHWLGDAVLEME